MWDANRSMTLFFIYNAENFSLDGKKFGGNFITDVACGVHPSSDVMYESAKLEIVPLSDKGWISSLLGTLAYHMGEWHDYMPCDTQNVLVKHIDNILAYYGEHIDEYYGAEDWDDYIILLLEVQEVLKQPLSDKYIKHFSL